MFLMVIGNKNIFMRYVDWAMSDQVRRRTWPRRSATLAPDPRSPSGESPARTALNAPEDVSTLTSN